MPNDSLPLDDIFRKREDLFRRLKTAIGHLPHDRQLAIITSWMSIDDLRHVVEFLEKSS